MRNSATALNAHLKELGEQLVVLRQFQQTTDKPYIKSALSFVIEDTQEAIAKTASRLRQLGQKPANQMPSDAAVAKLVRTHNQQTLGDKLQSVWQALKQRLDWYATQVKNLKDDADTQAILVALAEQARVRLERWENLMDEMKVSPNE